jgi:hypothetical protein
MLNSGRMTKMMTWILLISTSYDVHQFANIVSHKHIVLERGGEHNQSGIDKA